MYGHSTVIIKKVQVVVSRLGGVAVVLNVKHNESTLEKPRSFLLRLAD
jgi:hypothetical protein